MITRRSHGGVGQGGGDGKRAEAGGGRRLRVCASQHPDGQRKWPPDLLWPTRFYNTSGTRPIMLLPRMVLATAIGPLLRMVL